MTARPSRHLLVAAFVVSIPPSIFAQSSASFRLTEHVFNAGGRPAQAVVSSSESYRLSLDSIGEPIAGQALDGASYRLDGGVASAYPPPGEVGGLDILADSQTLSWFREPASTAYNVYTSPLSTLPGGYGACAIARVAGTSWVDPALPAPGNGVFYLVTGENRLREEGTKGYASSGSERSNPSPCPDDGSLFQRGPTKP
jgi:hypothetical protein